MSKPPKRRTLRRAKRKMGVARRPNQTGIYPGQRGRGCAWVVLAGVGATVAAVAEAASRVLA